MKENNTLWIARDERGSLYAYLYRPVLSACGSMYWASDIDETKMELPKDWYQEVTFLNSPVEVELKIKNNPIPSVEERLKYIIELNPAFAKVIEENFWDLLS